MRASSVAITWDSRRPSELSASRPRSFCNSRMSCRRRNDGTDHFPISPTTQAMLVAALGQLDNIPGQAEFIRQAAAATQQALRICNHFDED